MFRIGIGNDVHRLVAGVPLKLGGVYVPSELGSAGHSDGDALLHAICDAILGALGEGDIGTHFPDNDAQWEKANSIDLLSRVMWLVHERNFHIVNVDATVMLETPKIRPYVGAMRENIAGTLGLDVSGVSIKAKTGEGLDAVGRSEAVAAQAIVLVETNQERA